MESLPQKTPQTAPSALPVVVLISGRGSNLQALMAARDAGRLPIEIRAVLSDRPDAAGLRHAAAAGIDCVALDRAAHPDRVEFDHALFARIGAFAPALIVMAGFMRVLADSVVTPWVGRMINIHPSLLPKYPGLRTHARALAAGDVEHGASVHYVTPTLDSGPVIAQTRMAIHPDDTAESLSARLLPREHVLLVEILRLIAMGRIEFKAGAIHLDHGTLATPLLLDARNRMLGPDANPLASAS